MKILNRIKSLSIKDLTNYSYGYLLGSTVIFLISIFSGVDVLYIKLGAIGFCFVEGIVLLLILIKSKGWLYENNGS